MLVLVYILGFLHFVVYALTVKDSPVSAFPELINKCPESVNITEIDNYSVKKVGNRYLSAAEVTVPWDVSRITKASCQLVQCPRGRQCKHFYTMRFNSGVCRLLTDKSAFWAEVFAHTKPPLLCPLTKGIYHFRNASINVEKFVALFGPAAKSVFRDAIWNVKLTGRDQEEKEFACIAMKFNVTVNH